MKNYFNWLVEQELGKRWVYHTKTSTFNSSDWVSIPLRDQPNTFLRGRDFNERYDAFKYYYLKAGDRVFVFIAERSETKNVVVSSENLKRSTDICGKKPIEFDFHFVNKIKGFRNPKLVDISFLSHLQHNSNIFHQVFSSSPLVLTEDWKSAYAAPKFYVASEIRAMPTTIEADCLINPDISKIGLQDLLSEEPQIVQELSMFLRKQDDQQSSQTDIEKVVSHGFDKKRSFRH